MIYNKFTLPNIFNMFMCSLYVGKENLWLILLPESVHLKYMEMVQSCRCKSPRRPHRKVPRALFRVPHGSAVFTDKSPGSFYVYSSISSAHQHFVANTVSFLLKQTRKRQGPAIWWGPTCTFFSTWKRSNHVPHSSGVAAVNNLAAAYCSCNYLSYVTLYTVI